MEDLKTYLKDEREQEWRAEIRSKIKTKERTLKERVKMNEEDPDVRNKNSIEVNKGLTEEQALLEAQRVAQVLLLQCAHV